MGKHARLIWFQHLHKAGGTSLVELAKLSGERLYPYNVNGNPLDENGRELPIWEYNKEQLAGFVEQCFELEVSFVSVEWALPMIDVLAGDPRVRLVTVMRDPFRRFASNYRYDIRYGYIALCDADTYLNSSMEINIDGHPYGHKLSNYYTRYWSGEKLGGKQEVDNRTFERALENLKKMDVTMFLEDENPFKAMQRFGWEKLELHANPGEYDRILILKDFLKGRWQKTYRMLKNRPMDVGADFKDRFFETNYWDIDLYDRVKSHKGT